MTSGAPFRLISADGFSVEITRQADRSSCVTIVLMVGFTLLITRTSLGRPQRACEQDMKMASLLGVNIDRTISLTFVMGAALAAVAGLMVHALLRQDRFLHRLPRRHQGLHRGGPRRHRLACPGAMLGGLLIGLIEVVLVGVFLGRIQGRRGLRRPGAVLIFRPTGLLGRPEVEKV